MRVVVGATVMVMIFVSMLWLGVLNWVVIMLALACIVMFVWMLRWLGGQAGL